MIEHSMLSEEEKSMYDLDKRFDQPNGELIQQELITYVATDGGITKRVYTRRFTGDDYIDSYASTPLLIPVNE